MERIKKLENEKNEAYLKWRRAIKEALQDGKERRIQYAGDSLSGGLMATLDNGCEEKIPCVVDAIKVDEIHLIQKDFEDTDEWLPLMDLSSGYIEVLLESIVWEEEKVKE